MILVPFIRCVRLLEVLFALGEAVRGEPWEAEYTLHNLLSLETLSDCLKLHISWL